MDLYTFHGLTLEVKQEGQETGESLTRLLPFLSFARSLASVRTPSICLSVRLNGHGLSVPPKAHEVFESDGLCGLEGGDDFYLTEGSSLFHLQPLRGQGEAELAPGFFHQPPLLQYKFWAVGLLKLLRPLGVYSLHAAGVVTHTGLGLLIVGESGSGKSTLALGLVRQGWGYLSDDTVLLRLQPDGVEALAFRKHFHVDPNVTPDADLPLGEAMPDLSRRRRRIVDMEEAYPGQYIAGCTPRVLLFSRIVPHSHSTLLPLEHPQALWRLLSQSGPQLFDRGTMGQQLEALKQLVQQTSTYELLAGRDLYRDPMILMHLLREAEGEKRWGDH